jgi:predicted restriction endonuclease
MKLGTIHKEETKQRMSEAQRGEKNHNYGKQFPEETRQKMSEAQRGEKNHEWKDDPLFRAGVEFRKHPKPCEVCGSVEKLDMHHIDGNHENNVIENIMWLCHNHHMKIHGKINGSNFSYVCKRKG